MKLAISMALTASLFLVGCSDDKNDSDLGVGAQAGAQAKADSEYNRSIKAKIYNKMADMVSQVDLEAQEDGNHKVTLEGRSSILGAGDCTFNIKALNTWKKGNGTKLSGSHKKCNDIVAKISKSGEFTTVSFKGIYTHNTEFKAFFRTMKLQISSVQAAQDNDKSRAFAAALEGKSLEIRMSRLVWPSQMADVKRDRMSIAGDLEIEGRAVPTSESENTIIHTDSANIHLGEFHINVAGKQFLKKNIEVSKIKFDLPNANYFANSDRIRGTKIEIISDDKEASATATLR